MPSERKPLTPPDLARCQAEKPNGHSFMTLGGRPRLERCESPPDFVAVESKPGKDGQVGMMSLCVSCLKVFNTQMPTDYAKILTLEEYKNPLKPKAKRKLPEPKTDKQKVKYLRTLLERLQKEKYYEPNSDHHELCAGCGNSPYKEPPHEEGCFTVAIADALRRTK